jgi:cytidylate kinase
MEDTKRLPVITISRQYAALGRTIARGLQERLGIPFYDKDFVTKTAEMSGYSEEDIAREGESMSRGAQIMNTLLNNAAVYTSSYDGIYEAQKKVVLELAKEPCIIIGRCAGHILKEAGIPSFNIYLHADVEDRIERARALGENNGMDLAKYIAKRDALRNTYYKKYTGIDMGHSHSYTIGLDVGKLDARTCLDILVPAIKAAKLSGPRV